MRLAPEVRAGRTAHVPKRRWAAGWGLTAIGVLGCGGAATDEPGTSRRSGSLTAAPEAAAASGPGVPATDGVALLGPGSCDAVLAALQADLLARARQQAERAREWPRDEPTPESYQGGVTFDAAPQPVLGAMPLEEGDVLAADRGHVYLLDKEGGTRRLVALRAAPGQPLGVLATVAIEGAPLELLSRNGRVLVFSRIEGVLPELYESFPEYEPVYTKLTVLDFNSGADTGADTEASAAPPYVERELYVEGEYVFARQHDGIVRTVIQHVPKLLLDAPVLSATDILGFDRPQAQIDAQVDTWLEITHASILSSGLDAYLPGVYERHDGVLTARAPSCDSTFVPEPARVVPGGLSVFSLDLDASDLGGSDVDVAADVSAPLSSFTVYGYVNGIALDPAGAVLHQARRSLPDEEPRGGSHLHVFELDGTRARYAAAGRISDQATTIDRRPGMLRLLAARSLYEGDIYMGLERRALTLSVDGERLTELGSMVIETANDGLGDVHVVGDHAYLFASNVAGPGIGAATFALVALDLSDPAAPREMGRLSLPTSAGAPGPVPVDRLLTIGGVQAEDGGYHSEIWAFDIGGTGAPSVGATFAWPGMPSSDPRALSFSPDGARAGVPISGSFTGSFDIIDLSASEITHLASLAPDIAEPTLLQCLELHGLPTDPESIAALEANPPRLAVELFQCSQDWPRPYVQRGLLRAEDAIVLSYDYREPRWTAASYSLLEPDAPPLSQLDF